MFFQFEGKGRKRGTLGGKRGGVWFRVASSYVFPAAAALRFYVQAFVLGLIGNRV